MKCDVSKCHAACCGIVPIPEKTVEKHLGDIQGPYEILPFQVEGRVVVLKKGEPVCGFLTPDFRCAIYADRPDVCRMFGKGPHPLMKCNFLCRISDSDKKQIENTAKKAMEALR